MYQGLLSKPRSQVVLCHSSSSLTYEGDVPGSNIGLAGCPKRVKIEARCRMTKILMAVRGGIEILRQERDLPILTGGMGDSQFKTDGAMRDEKREIHRLRRTIDSISAAFSCRVYNSPREQ